MTTSDCRIRVYALLTVEAKSKTTKKAIANNTATVNTSPIQHLIQLEGVLSREINCVHRDAINDISIFSEQQCLVSVGHDGFVKLWDYQF